MRLLSLIYGVLSYFIFFAVFLYLIAFVGDLWVPKSVSINSLTPAVDPMQATIVNIILIIAWGIQHTAMARQSFKDKINQIFPPHTERSTYTLISSLVLAALMWVWQPIDGTLWQITSEPLVTIIWVLFWLGWGLVLISTFLTDHFDLFGLRQVYLNFINRDYTPIGFKEILFYKWVRHPMMLGLLIAFWAIPTMTYSHLLFSVGMSVYIFVGLYYEEKSLREMHGSAYISYTERTGMVLPRFKG